MAITVKPLSKCVGAEVQGVDISRDLTPADVAAINRALVEYCVILFRDQKLSTEQQERFASNFGTLAALRPKPGLNHLPGNVMIIGNVKAEGRDGILPHGDMQFHSDQCFYEVPGKATTLYAIEIPRTGGNTLFASAYRAYDALSPAVKARVAKLDAFHAYDYDANGQHKLKQIPANAPHAVHPVVVEHPETHRPHIFVNRLMTDHIVGLPRAESDALLNALYEETERPEFVYEHVWRPGDLLMWDNRCALHARTNYDSVNERRVLRRVAIEGEQPPMRTQASKQ